MRNLTHRRLWTSVGAALAVALVLTSCGGGGATKAAAREAPAVIKGIDAGANDLKAMLDDLMGATQTAEHETPTAFQEAVDAAAAGKTLESSKAKIDALGTGIDHLIDFIGGAIDLDTSAIPQEASQLAAAALIRDGGPEFKAYVDELAAKLLRGLFCTGLRDAIDAETAQQSDAAGLNYVPLDQAAAALDYAEQYISGPYANYAAFEDVPAIVDGAVAKAQSWVTSAQQIYESPTGQIRQANIYYFRTCVVRKR